MWPAWDHFQDFLASLHRPQPPVLGWVRACPPGLCWPLPASIWHVVPLEKGAWAPGVDLPAYWPLPYLSYERDELSSPRLTADPNMDCLEFEERKKRK